MKKSVFISSTFDDLKEIRKKVWQLLKEHDVIIKGMEDFGARKAKPLETCLNEVSQSDIYIGIIAFRLGTIDEKTGKSITQLEYEKALELGKEILIYFMDDKLSSIAPIYVDKGSDADALKIFKETLKENHTVDFFINPDDLSNKLSNRFSILLTKLNPEPIQEKDKSKGILQKFIVMPKILSGFEIECKLKINSSPFPLSNEICRNFNFQFGETAGFGIEFIDPKIKENPIDLLVVEKYLFDDFIKNSKSEDEFSVELLFSKNSAEKISTFFNKKRLSIEIENPKYDPSIPESDSNILSSTTSVFTLGNLFGMKYNPKYIYKTIVEKGEGQVLARLKSIKNTINKELETDNKAPDCVKTRFSKNKTQ
ncbi:MAG: DUF4062 domain-containing protein [bacterium]